MSEVYGDIREVAYESSSNEVIYEKPPVNLVEPWLIFSFHRKPMEQISRITKHWHRSIEMIVPRVGDAEVWMNGRRHIIHPGQFMVIPSGMIHESRRHDYDLPNEGYAFRFRYDFISHAIPDLNDLAFPLEPIEEDPAIARKIDEIVRLQESDHPYRRLKINILMNEALLFLYEKHAVRKEGSAKEESRNREIVLSALAMLDSRVNEAIRMTEIADALHVSYAYLSRKFREETGMTMSDYFTDLKLNRAEELIRRSDLSLEEIARETGFGEYHSFIRTFRNKRNILPSSLRRNRN